MIDELLKFNEAFVAEKGYEKYITTKYPDKKIAIVTCMDTRLVTSLLVGLEKQTHVSVGTCGRFFEGNPLNIGVRSVP